MVRGPYPLERSSQEQSRGGRQITHAIEHISDLVQQLNQAQKQRRHASDQVLAATEELAAHTRRQSAVLERLKRTATALFELLEANKQMP